MGDRLGTGTPLSTAPILLGAPLAGWSTPLEEVPDEVFAARMLGDGVAIDPTADTLHAPCDAQLVVIAAAHHALTLRTTHGCQILLHVGLDTVALRGEGFELLVRPDAQVKAGEALLRFDLDLLAQRAKSLLTPVIISTEGGFRITRRTLSRSLRPGEFLMEVEPAGLLLPAQVPAAAGGLSRVFTVTLEHGIHARPAALVVASLRNLAAEVRIHAHGRHANARSTVALMGLGVAHGQPIELHATGAEAQAALDAVASVLAPAAAHRPAPPQAAAAVAMSAAPAPADLPEGVVAGAIASGGFAVGPVVQLRPAEAQVREQGAGVQTETAALERARAAVSSRLARSVGADAAGTPAAAREIASAHRELLDDPELLEAASALIRQGKAAGFAWRQAIRGHVAVLRSLPDARLRERVDDLLDLEAQVLAGLGAPAAAVGTLPPGAIVVARELLPSQLLGFADGGVAGIAMAEGGATSHAAILAAAMGIPALVALGPQVLEAPTGNIVVLDAERGRLETRPTDARVAQARAHLRARAAAHLRERAAAQAEGRTRDGTRIQVLANIGSVAEARAAIANGAEGCGLLRTEFLFLDRTEPPTPAEQAHAYQQIADVLGERPFTIRTLDAGGDKPIAYLRLPEEQNPALGLRGVRTSLAFPQLLHDQLRAVLAVTGGAQVRLLLPMVTDASDLAAVRAVLAQVQATLAPREPLEVGVMIETPASAVLADLLVREADFLSIGTNDLTQYTLAMDRLHPQLALRLDALHPAVLTLIGRAAQAARAHGRHAAVCGGLASEALAAPLLVGLGVDELSAVPSAVPQVKAQLARVTLTECQGLAQQALQLPDAHAVRALLAQQPWSPL